MRSLTLTIVAILALLPTACSTDATPSPSPAKPTDPPAPFPVAPTRATVFTHPNADRLPNLYANAHFTNIHRDPRTYSGGTNFNTPADVNPHTNSYSNRGATDAHIHTFRACTLHISPLSTGVRTHWHL